MNYHTTLQDKGIEIIDSLMCPVGIPVSCEALVDFDRSRFTK